MTEEKKPEEKKRPNIVKKVFDRQALGGGHVSTLFTHTKEVPKVLAASTAPDAKDALSFTPLPTAIDFGSYSVKLVQLAKEPKGEMRVNLMDEEPYEKLPNMDLFSRQKTAFQKILARNPVGHSAVISLSSKEVQLYNFVFPPMSEKELEEAISWKVKQARPFDLELEKVNYGFIKWGTLTTTTSTQQRVTVVCAPGDKVAKRTDWLNQTGLKTLAVEVAPVSLVNIKKFKPGLFMRDETVLWLDLGAEESSVAVEKNGAVLFFRNLAITSHQLTKQLSQFIRIDEARAEELKRRYGLSYWNEEKDASGALQAEKTQHKEEESAVVFYGVISSLENLVVDIEHSFKYFSYQVTQSQINKFDRVFITGGGANLKNLDRFLSARLGVPVEKLNPLSGLTVAEGLTKQKAVFLAAPSSFAVSLGLALGQAMPKAMRMNLLVTQRSVSLNTVWKQLKKEPKKALAIACCLVFALLGPQLIRDFSYRAQLSVAEKKVKTAKAELSVLQSAQLEAAEEETKLMDQRQLLELKLRLLRESGRGSRQFSEVLAKLSELLPDEAWITKLTYSEKKMTLIGLTLKNELIVIFMEKLSQSNDFKDVTFNYTQQEANTKVYRFEVMMSVR